MDFLLPSTGVQHRQKATMVTIFQDNTREFSKIITSTGALFCEISAFQYCTGHFSGSENSWNWGGPPRARLKKSSLPYFGGLPMTPDPNTSAKVLQYKWEAYRDTN